MAVDAVRGFEREILFSSLGGYARGGGIPLTACVIEVVESDSQGKCLYSHCGFTTSLIPTS